MPAKMEGRGPPLRIPRAIAPLPGANYVTIEYLLRFDGAPTLPTSSPNSVPEDSSLPSRLLPALLVVCGTALSGGRKVMGSVAFTWCRGDVRSVGRVLFALTLTSVTKVTGTRRGKRSCAMRNLVGSSALGKRALCVDHCSSKVGISDARIAGKRFGFAKGTSVPYFYHVSTKERCTGFVLRKNGVRIGMLARGSPGKAPVGRRCARVSSGASRLIARLEGERTTVRRRARSGSRRLQLGGRCTSAC